MVNDPSLSLIMYMKTLLAVITDWLIRLLNLDGIKYFSPTILISLQWSHLTTDLVYLI